MKIVLHADGREIEYEAELDTVDSCPFVDYAIKGSFYTMHFTPAEIQELREWLATIQIGGS